MIFGRLKPKPMLRRPSICLSKPTNPNIPRPRYRCKKIATNSWHSSTFQPSIGRASEPATQLNPPFATIRHRTKRSKGCLNRDGMLHIPPCDIPSECTAGQRMFKLGQCAEENWPSYAALIISPKSSLASNSKTELKPQKQARSLLDTKTSNTKL